MSITNEFDPVTGAIKLSRDLAILVNNPIGSDVRFLVGTGDVSVSTFHGHSQILCARSRYFSTLHKENPEWRENKNGEFRKPNILPEAFRIVLHYIYTGSAEVTELSLLPGIIAAAEEMELEELSIACQSKLIAELNASFANSKDGKEKTTQPKVIPFNHAIRDLLVPGLILSYDHALGELSDLLLKFTYDHIGAIITSQDNLKSFLDKIPAIILNMILSTDDLSLEEHEVWDLALSWACYQTKILKTAVESQLRLIRNVSWNDEEDTSDESEATGVLVVADRKLKEVKAKIVLLIPTVRFTLMEPDQYRRRLESINYFVPSRRLSRIQRFFSNPDSVPLDAPRTAGIPYSKIVNRTSGDKLREWIHAAGVISGCSSPRDLAFKLLFQASLHGFQAATFHKQCDGQGPTLVLVRSSDNYLFGGVNFNNWLSSGSYAQSSTNFLFALADGSHRDKSEKFNLLGTNNGYGNYNASNYGPTFGGGHDLCIADQSNANATSYSAMPHSYGGSGASNSSLAGTRNFTVMNYEVFAISKY